VELNDWFAEGGGQTSFLERSSHGFLKQKRKTALVHSAIVGG